MNWIADGSHVYVVAFVFGQCQFEGLAVRNLAGCGVEGENAGFMRMAGKNQVRGHGVEARTDVFRFSNIGETFRFVGFRVTDDKAVTQEVALHVCKQTCGNGGEFRPGPFDDLTGVIRKDAAVEAPADYGIMVADDD